MDYSIGCVSYKVERFTFPAGEVGVKLSSSEKGHIGEDITLRVSLKSSEDVMTMLLTVDALRRQHPKSKIFAKIPYVPYSRQDRVCNIGESLSVAVMANLINSCGFSGVEVVDPHSDVAPALINNCKIVDQYEVFRGVKSSWRDVFIVAPDAGAYKKSHKFAEKVGAAGVITCNKVRELSTGKIKGLSCQEDVEGLNLFVLDDICDGGRTFIEVSNLLRAKCKTIELAVTHGIFSKGVELVADQFDKVYTTNSYHGKSDFNWQNIQLINVL